MKLFEGDRQVGTLQPEKRRYVSSAMPMTEAGIDRNLWRDRYVSLGEPLSGEPPQWSFRVYHKPFVSWIWLGAVYMVLGGGLAAFDRRYRQAPLAARAPGDQVDVGMGASGVRVAGPVPVVKGAVS
jgi:cytochrome c-type biogenesis protein CcmF